MRLFVRKLSYILKCIKYVVKIKIFTFVMNERTTSSNENVLKRISHSFS